MKTRIILKSAALMAAALILWPTARAADLTRCDKVFEEVRAAVEKEPQKVLVIVEDAMVANEPCACEIVKAAILASKANAELTRQIVLAATHVAPKMAGLIAQCAGDGSGGKEVVESVKQAIGVQPTSPESTGGSDYLLTPGDIRGVYLIQPSTGGFMTTNNDCACDTTKTTTKIIVRRTPPRRSIPQSPSQASGT